MATKRELNPRRSLNGKSRRKSLACFREVRIERNMMSPVTEKQRPMSEEIAKTSNAGLPSSIGLPSSVVPPGTALAVAKETPATRAATTEQDSDVSFSHSLLSFIRSACDFLKISRDVLPLLLLLK
ncbi:hypothetical protein L195_g041224 [Trifolium pratense]|uniref:Uncharacterized protein n=1 Tax=Trifolium pratense TaxID=57577 RepID=A0A2K3M2X3_TRIPR|nr:hypothetical protein L195_g041224 [Trifolium pratense]